MDEPMSDVPNRIVVMCIRPKMAWVMQNAIPIETTMEKTEPMMGITLLNENRSMIATTVRETAEIAEASLKAELELLWLWKLTP